jgi:hypothetical protein
MHAIEPIWRDKSTESKRYTKKPPLDGEEGERKRLGCKTYLYFIVF